MKSGRQRRDEIRRKRLERAKRLEGVLRRPGPGAATGPGTAPADTALLARHNNTYGPLPTFYADKVFLCRDCGEEQVWTAKQQKWWYEVRLGAIDSTAVRCLPCRRARRAQRALPGANLLAERGARLRALGARAPDADAWAEVEAALADKWWGVRTVAIATLGAWGDARAVTRLKALLAGLPDEGGWNTWTQQARRAIFSALGHCLPGSEAAWALQMYLERDDTWALQPVLARQPAEFWEPVVAAEGRRDDPERLARLCLVLAQVAAEPERRRRWQQRFESHPAPEVRQWAIWAWSGRPQ